MTLLRADLSARALLELDDTDLGRLLELGVSCMEAKLSAQARSVFLLLVRLEPRCFVGHLYLGFIADLMGQPHAAVERYRTAGALLEARDDRTDDDERTLREIVLVLAIALLKVGAREEALDHLARLAIDTSRDETCAGARGLLDALPRYRS